MGNIPISPINNRNEEPVAPREEEAPVETGSHGLPEFIVIKSNDTGRYAYAMDSEGCVCCEMLNVFSPFAKIEVETAKIDRKYVHLRFCCNNKYWSRGRNSNTNKWIVAASNQPQEDKTKESCTLFGQKIDGKFLSLVHVQTGRPVQINYMYLPGEKAPHYYLYIADEHSARVLNFNFVDWDTLVIMPKHVTFKGYNGKYLRSGWIEGHEYLEFSSDDRNEDRTAYEITMNPDGHLLIRSVYFGKYWRRSPNWIWGDSTRESVGKDIDTLFWPVKVDNNTIALRNAGNRNFCKALTTEGKTRCLNAAVATITTEARLQVQELVLEKYIYDIEYRINDARVYDEKAFIVGTGAATNNTQEKATLSMRVSYQDTSSYSFTNSSSLKLGFEVSIKTGLPLIGEDGIKISTEMTNSLEWGRVTENRITAEATYEAVVPPMSTVKVNYIATQGKCNVPFSYTQRDKRSGDGSFVTTRNVDGVFAGVNYYDFRFEQVLKREQKASI